MSDVIAEGFHGHNHWRQRKLADGAIITECSDDKQTWQAGELTALGIQKRDATISMPVAVAVSPVNYVAPVSKLHWLWIAGALGSGGLIMAAVDAAIRIWGG